jgi:hypothetical protein
MAWRKTIYLTDLIAAFPAIGVFCFQAFCVFLTFHRDYGTANPTREQWWEFRSCHTIGEYLWGPLAAMDSYFPRTWSNSTLLLVEFFLIEFLLVSLVVFLLSRRLLRWRRQPRMDAK